MKKNKGAGKSGSGEAESATAAAAAMVSRRRILSRSRDDLHMSANGGEADEAAGGARGHPMRNVANYFRDEEDVWYLKEKLYRVSQAGRQAGNSHCSQ